MRIQRRLMPDQLVQESSKSNLDNAVRYKKMFPNLKKRIIASHSFFMLNNIVLNYKIFYQIIILRILILKQLFLNNL